MRVVVILLEGGGKLLPSVGVVVRIYSVGNLGTKPLHIIYLGDRHSLR